MLKSRILPVITAAMLTIATPVWAAGNGSDSASRLLEVAALEGGPATLARETPVPSVLSAMDESLYRMAFDFAERDQWASVERVVERIHDPILVGKLLAQHYLAPDAKVTPTQFKSWLDHYADLPEASAVYALARKDPGIKVKSLTAPASGYDGSLTDADDDDAAWENFTVDDSDRHLSKAEARKLEVFKKHFRAEVKQSNYGVAASLRTAEARHLLSHADEDEMKLVLARGLFGDGRDREALPYAEQVASRSGQILPAAHWLAGLILWRMDRPADAATQFEAVANNAQLSAWMISASAYWSARADLASSKPAMVNHWLEQAALYPRTFYGMLARRALGLDIEYSWIARPFTDADSKLLAQVPGARRALALVQIGDKNDAEIELRHLVFGATKSLSRAMLALAHAEDMPDLAVGLSEIVSSQDGKPHDTTDYPLPDWTPAGGWTVDRALILAIVRQESGFNPHAKSSAGAVGLMQVLPTTAKLMGSNGKLTDPASNLAAGQSYVKTLLANQAISTNLVYLAAAYNGGPNAVVRWQQTLHSANDPLLFLESIPMQETRVFVQRVLINFWAYRDRFGEHSSSIDALAAGSWPLYDAPGSGVMADSPMVHRVMAGGETAGNDEN